MKSAFSIFALVTIISLPVQAHHLQPVPEAGLWRSENRVLNGYNDPHRVTGDLQPAELTNADYQALMNSAVIKTVPEVTMECMSVAQAAGLGRLDSMQRIIQRKLPDCQFDLKQTDRSTLRILGRCDNNQGATGELHGLVQIISTREIHASFMVEDRLRPAGGLPLKPNANRQRHEIHRWTSSDCGLAPAHERITF